MIYRRKNVGRPLKPRFADSTWRRAPLRRGESLNLNPGFYAFLFPVRGRVLVLAQ